MFRNVENNVTNMCEENTKVLIIFMSMKSVKKKKHGLTYTLSSIMIPEFKMLAM